MKRFFTIAAAVLGIAAANTFAAHRGDEANYLLSADAGQAIIDEVFRAGSWSGEFGLAFRYEDPEADEDGHAGWGFFEFDWESGAWHGLQLGVGGIAILEAWDEGSLDGILDEDGAFKDSAAWTDLYIKYAVPKTKTEILIGRTKFKKPASGDGDVHQGIQLTIKDIPNVTIYASAVCEWMDDASTGWDLDGIQDDWVEMDDVNTGDYGMGEAGNVAYTLMAKIKAVPDLLTLTPYVQYQEDVATSLGIEFEAEVALNETVSLGLDGIYAHHMEDTPDDMYPDDEDVSQYLLHAYAKVQNLKVGFGCYHISDDIALYNGLGEPDPGDDFESVYIMDEFDPMEEDLAKYGEAPNNDTYFVDASYSWRFLELAVVYGWVDNAWIKKTGADDGKAQELDVVLNIAITKNLEAELAYVNLDDDYSGDGDDSVDVVAGAITFSF